MWALVAEMGNQAINQSNPINTFLKINLIRVINTELNKITTFKESTIEYNIVQQQRPKNCNFPVGRLSWLSRNFPGCLEIFQTVHKLINLPNC